MRLTVELMPGTTVRDANDLCKRIYCMETVASAEIDEDKKLIEIIRDHAKRLSTADFFSWLDKTDYL